MIKKAIVFAGITVVVFALSAPGLAAQKPLTGVRLVWSPTTPKSQYGSVDLTAVSGVKVEIRDLADHREKPDLIGENREKEDKGVILPVTTSDKPAAFVTDALRRIFGDAGLSVVTTGGDVILSGELTRFIVLETASYQGEVNLKMELKSPKGKVLWSGVADGTGRRFGRSYKTDNYIETLSDSVMDAAYSLLQNESFMKALAEK